MDSSISEVQFGDPGEGSHTNQSQYPNNMSSFGLCLDSDDDMTDRTKYNSKENVSFKSEEGMDSSDAAYGSYESASGCLSLPPSGNIASTPFDSLKLSCKTESGFKAQKLEVMGPLESSQEDKMDTHENTELFVANSEEMACADTFTSAPCTNDNEPPHPGENSAVSESVEGSTSDETSTETNFHLQLDLEEKDGDDENNLEFNVSPTKIATDASPRKDTGVLKFDMLSDEEEVSFPKSGAESSSSKDESPSRPSCSGTSHRGMNSLSSDSEDDLPDIHMALPFKKRKRDSLVETIGSSSSSCSEDETIDYANLTPEQIKALIEQAKNIKHKCLCPKRKLADLAERGPTKPSSKCNIGKGDWREKHPCPDCAGGVCHETHKHGRGRKRYTHTRMTLAKTRARGTIGQDVPIIDLSDEEGSPVPNRVASEVTITTAPPGECIVLSSSDDDSDIVCEGVIKPDPKPQEPRPLGSYLLSGSPDVEVLNVASASMDGAAASSSAAAPLPPPPGYVGFPPPVPSSIPGLPVLPMPADMDLLWPDFDNEAWNEMFCDNMLGPANMPGMPATTAQASTAAAAPASAPERPASPEGWSCPICLESKTAVPEIMSTTCGHIFCGTCIRSAVKLHKKCPTCRKKLTVKQFHKIFL
ncbi:uncharacterized protein LOC117650903 [Thrips palmi]|uniref:Uncharacterized protein LOC117650903 n=1 Tax=Thrips palmi TaxID=161013 RepID=A0A6P9A0I0_THRPL|nr:uncharacterized protein LOC117650903 [Thrips palmi]